MEASLIASIQLRDTPKDEGASDARLFSWGSPGLRQGIAESSDSGGADVSGSFLSQTDSLLLARV